MPDLATRRRLDQLPWDEAAALLRGCGVAVVPIGSCEQHGKHLALGTDYLIAQELAARVLERVEVGVLPTMPFGHSSNHLGFPGTVSLQPQTVYAVMRDITRSLLGWGVKRILFLSGHSGNFSALEQACGDVREAGGIACVVQWWVLAGKLNPAWALTGHADRLEMSGAWAIDPQLVRPEKARDNRRVELTPHLAVESWHTLTFKRIPVNTWVRSFDGSQEGVFGLVKPASAEFGDEVLAACADYVAELVEDLKAIDLAALRAASYEATVQP